MEVRVSCVYILVCNRNILLKVLVPNVICAHFSQL